MIVRQILRNVRISLRDPRAQQPSDRTLLVLLSRVVQNLLAEANLRGGYWAVDETEITVNPNTADYIIPVQGFGKPIEVRAVYPANLGHQSHDVDFYSLGDLNYQEWDRPSYLPMDLHTDGRPFSDQRVAFYHKQGNTYMRIAQGGPPAGTVYRIIYRVGQFEDPQLDDDLLLPEHSGLVETRLALAACPHAEWFDDEAANKARRSELTTTLLEEQKIAYTLFRSSIATMTAADQPTYRILDSIDS